MRSPDRSRSVVGVTTYGVIRALARRWYVVLLGLVATLAVASSLHSRPGVYFVDGEVYLTAPAGARVDGIGDRNTSLISLAGLVEREVNALNDQEEPVSPDVTLPGMGVRHGTQVALPNSGGQWNYYFTRPVLLVQAVAATPEETRRMYDETVADVVESLERIQVADGISPDSRVTTRTVPHVPVVSFMGGFPTRAAAVALVLGLAVTTVLAVLVDHLVLTRRSRRSRSPEPDVVASVV
jgi:hypothetical protein